MQDNRSNIANLILDAWDSAHARLSSGQSTESKQLGDTHL